MPIYDEDSNIIGWKSIVEAKDMNKILEERNCQHLRQAVATLFGHGWAQEQLRNKDTREDTIQSILDRKFDLKHPTEIVNEWVRHLKRQYDENALKNEVSKIGAKITTAEFRKFFKEKPERTGSSPSQRHMGHYKSILHLDYLVQLHTQMLNIGLLAGIALPRWKYTLSLMMEKDVGCPRLHRLRIIQLFEADFNFLFVLVFGIRLTEFAAKHCNVHESQYGSTYGKQCQSTVLNKILTYDIMRMSKGTGAISELDAKACYDRLIPILVVIACRSIGLGKEASDLLYDSLTDTTYQVCTAMGKLQPYKPDGTEEAFGVGQGSGGAPTFWKIINNITLHTMD